MVIPEPSDEDRIDIPLKLARCPYCKSPLCCSVDAATEEKPGLWVPTSIMLDCWAEPDIEDEAAFEAFVDAHSELPYVMWLPIRERVLRWLQKGVRAGRITGDEGALYGHRD